MNAPAVVVVGEALVDLLVDTDPRHPVAWPGGSPANTVIALARLGTPVGFAGRFGNDRFGDLLLANLTANGVDLSYAVEADELTQALDYASAVAALACTRPGADPPHAHEVVVQGGTHA